MAALNRVNGWQPPDRRLTFWDIVLYTLSSPGATLRACLIMVIVIAGLWLDGGRMSAVADWLSPRLSAVGGPGGALGNAILLGLGASGTGAVTWAVAWWRGRRVTLKLTPVKPQEPMERKSKEKKKTRKD